MWKGVDRLLRSCKAGRAGRLSHRGVGWTATLVSHAVCVHGVREVEGCCQTGAAAALGLTGSKIGG